MKKFRNLVLVVALLVFSTGLENCTANTESYCQSVNQNNNCKKNNNDSEKSASDVFPDNDLIIKI